MTQQGRQRKNSGAFRRFFAGLANIFSRGLALFFGIFSLVNAVAQLVHSGVSPNLWWIDPSFIGSVPGHLVQGAAAGFLVVYAIFPRMALWRRIVTAALSGFLAIAALQNTISFYDAVNVGAVAAAPKIPLSAIFALIFIFMTLVIIFSKKPSRLWTLAGVVAIALIVALIFPLGQMMVFGKTDYRRNADVAIVLGARVHENGRPSGILLERLDTAIDLYEQGYVPKLLMSGGIEAGGIVNEAQGMKAYAVEQGVPAKDILLDEHGDNTDATVENTISICRENGFEKIVVVSTFYHLPRIKLAYLGAGQNVYTVPAAPYYPMPKLPQFMVREIPAWWAYWARDLY